MTSLQRSKNNFLLTMSLFGVVAVGGSALFLSSVNNRVNVNSGASNVEQTLKDKLVKKGTPAFSPCKRLDAKYTYALIGNGVKKVAESCIPLVVSASAAESFVGKLVLVAGTYTDGVFYATKIQDANAKPSMSPKPSTGPNVDLEGSRNQNNNKPVKSPLVPPVRY